MKYISMNKLATTFHLNSDGSASGDNNPFPQGSVLVGREGNIKIKKGIHEYKRKVVKVESVNWVTPQGGKGFTFPAGSNHFIGREIVMPVKQKIGESDTSNMSGAEAIAKVGGVDVLIPVGIFAGLGFAIGSIIGENKVALTLGGAVIGGFIGMSGSGSEQKMSVAGRAPKKPSKSTYKQGCKCDHTTCPDGYCGGADGCWCIEQLPVNADGRGGKPVGRPTGTSGEVGGSGGGSGSQKQICDRKNIYGDCIKCHYEGSQYHEWGGTACAGASA